MCKEHVKDALKMFTVPHVRKINYMKYTCSICEKKAEVKIFYAMPYYRENIESIKKE